MATGSDTVSRTAVGPEPKLTPSAVNQVDERIAHEDLRDAKRERDGRDIRESRVH